jgi:hypothetical protein
LPVCATDWAFLVLKPAGDSKDLGDQDNAESTGDVATGTGDGAVVNV